MALNPYRQMESYKQRKLSRIGEGYKLPNIGENIKRIQTTSKGIQKRSGVPVSTQFNLQRENEMAAGQAFSDTAAPLYLAKERERDILKDEIMSLGVKGDQFAEAEKEKRDAAKDAKNKLWTKLGFTAAGVIAAPFTGGASIPIMSGLGDVAAGAGMGTGEMGEPDQIDEGLIAQGLMNTVSSVASEINLAKPKAMTEMLAEHSADFVKMDDIAQQNLLDMIKFYVQANDYDAATKLINETFPQVAQPTGSI